MTLQERKAILCHNIELLQKSSQWLKNSFDKASVIDFNKEIQERELEILETFSNRYSRTVDIFLNKALRSLDFVELEDTSKKLDIVIRAEKRGFIEDYNLLIEMKDLRNELVHEYIQEALYEKFREILFYTPLLLTAIQKFISYSQKSYCNKL